MKSLTTFAMLLWGAGAVAAEEAPGPGFAQMDSRDLAQFIWTQRPIVVFADSPFDPAFTEQMEALRAREGALEDRDVVVLVDTDPEAASELRRTLRPRGFMLVLIGKDGRVALRKPRPWDVREITRSIDKMPMRQQELRREREAAAAGQ